MLGEQARTVVKHCGNLKTLYKYFRRDPKQLVLHVSSHYSDTVNECGTCPELSVPNESEETQTLLPRANWIKGHGEAHDATAYIKLNIFIYFSSLRLIIFEWNPPLMFELFYSCVLIIEKNKHDYDFCHNWAALVLVLICRNLSLNLKEASCNLNVISITVLITTGVMKSCLQQVRERVKVQKV